MKKQNRTMHDYVMGDLFVDVPGITSKAMFGGFGFYKNGIIFAIIVEGQLYFKVDDQTRPNFEALDSHPFVYSRGEEKFTTMPYWTVPESIMEDGKKLLIWMNDAVQVSLRTDKKKKP